MNMCNRRIIATGMIQLNVAQEPDRVDIAWTARDGRVTGRLTELNAVDGIYSVRRYLDREGFSNAVIVLVSIREDGVLYRAEVDEPAA